MNRSTLNTRKTRLAIVAAALAVTMAACSSSEETTPTDTAPANTEAPSTTETIQAEVQITDAWVRSVPGGKGAVYATINSPIDDAILSASIEPASAAGKVEVHEVITDADGKMVMQMVDRIELPAGQAVMLKPGGYHIMLMMMPEILEIDTEIAVTLVLEKAGPVTFTAVVRENTMPDMGSGDMGMDSGDMESGMGG